MKEIINYIKELQREYHEGTPAYNVLRKLEVTLPGMFPKNFAHEPTKEADTEALNKHSVMESLPLAAKDYAKKIMEETDYSAGKIHLEQAFIEGAKFLSGNAP